MATEKLRDEFWDDFDATADIAPMIELVPELTPELMAIPTDDPESRVLWPPTDEEWVKVAEHTELAPTEAQLRILGVIALKTAYANHKSATDSTMFVQSREMLVNLGCHEYGDELVAEAMLARQMAYMLNGTPDLFLEANDVYKQYVGTFPTRETQKADATRMKEQLIQDAEMSRAIFECMILVSDNPLRHENIRRVIYASMAQLAHYRELNGIVGEMSDEALFDVLAVKSDVDSRYDLAPDPLPPVRIYADNELVQLPLDTIVDSDSKVIPPGQKNQDGDENYKVPVEPDPTELFTLMNKVIDARTKADAQIASRYWRAAEIQAEIVLRNLNFEETPKNVLLVHRARLAAFVLQMFHTRSCSPYALRSTVSGLVKATGRIWWSE